MIIKRTGRAALTAGAFVFLLGLAGEALAAEDEFDCAAFPPVPWWSALTHTKIVSYVNMKQDGDWDSYIEKWESQVEKLEDILERGGVAVVTKDKIRLEDEKLREYIEQVRKRVEVTECVAQSVELTNFSTAAGGDQPAAGQSSRIVKVTSGVLSMEINGGCEGQAARFQLVNTGDPWPKTSTISVFDLRDDSLITKRRLRLVNGQSASFKIDNLTSPVASVGLWIEPSWDERDIRYDVSLRCG